MTQPRDDFAVHSTATSSTAGLDAWGPIQRHCRKIRIKIGLKTKDILSSLYSSEFTNFFVKN